MSFADRTPSGLPTSSYDSGFGSESRERAEALERGSELRERAEALERGDAYRTAQNELLAGSQISAMASEGSEAGDKANNILDSISMAAAAAGADCVLNCPVLSSGGM